MNGLRHGLLLLASLWFLTFSPALLAAQTAIKTGERVTGTTKQCYYSYAGAEYVKTIQLGEVCPMTIRVPTRSPPPSPTTVTARKTGERTTGTTKQCFYSYAGSQYTKTMRSYEVCPISIRVRTRG